jgi:hypothetical protein
MTRSRRVDASGPVQVYEATDVVGESTLAAYHAAEAWLVHPTDEREQREETPPPPRCI